jgi:hypothetical protein
LWIKRVKQKRMKMSFGSKNVRNWVKGGKYWTVGNLMLDMTTVPHTYTMMCYV